jgi:ribose-phosphate pyrophosphokinase
VDDMIDTGTTLTLAARSLKENGALRTYALVSHGESFHPVSFLLLTKW